MATPSFQGPTLFLAIGAALLTVMMVAVVVPRFFLDGETNWILAVGAGLLVGVIVAVVFSRRTAVDAGRAERTPPNV